MIPRPIPVLVLGLLVLCGLVIGSVSTGTYRDIAQGEVIAWNENVSLARVIGWSDTLAWWGNNHTPSLCLPDLVLTIDRPTRVFVDPHRFPPGDYYKWSGNWERAGNNLAFSVSMAPPKPTPTPTPTTTESPMVLAMPSRLPALTEKIVADILICRGHPAAILCRNSSALWILGHSQWAYLTPALDGTYALSPELTSSFPPGDYTLLFQDTGTNGVQEVVYVKEKNEVWFNNLKTFEVIRTNVDGWVPSQIQDLVLYSLGGSDDNTTVATLAVQDPAVEIKHLYDAGTDSVEANGYATVPDGTPITLTIDPERVLTDNSGSTITTPVHQTDPGSLRTWQAIFPIDWNATAPGRHFLTATLPSGAAQTVSFWVYNLPVGQERPQGFVHYLSGNEFESSASIKIVEVVRTVQVPIYIPAPAPVPVQSLAESDQTVPAPDIETGVSPLLLLPIPPLLYLGSVFLRAQPPIDRRPTDPFARSQKINPTSRHRSIREVVIDDLAFLRARINRQQG